MFSCSQILCHIQRPRSLTYTKKALSFRHFTIAAFPADHKGGIITPACLSIETAETGRERRTNNKKEHDRAFTKFLEAGIFGIHDAVADCRNVDIGVIPHLPILVRQPVLPGPLLGLLEELVIFRHCEQTDSLLLPIQCHMGVRHTHPSPYSLRPQGLRSNPPRHQTPTTSPPTLLLLHHHHFPPTYPPSYLSLSGTFTPPLAAQKNTHRDNHKLHLQLPPDLAITSSLPDRQITAPANTHLPEMAAKKPDVDRPSRDETRGDEMR